MTYNVFSGTLNPTQSINQSMKLSAKFEADTTTHTGFCCHQTSGKSNLTQGRIDAARGRFNRIRQMASMCIPI